MTSLVDFHCHLDLYSNYEEVFKEAERNKIYTLAVTTTPRAWEKNLELTKDCRFVRPALGLHPQVIDANIDSELRLFEAKIKYASYIGEVGLDGRLKNLAEQKRVFRKIAQLCALYGNKCLSVHAVRATNEVLDILNEAKVYDNCIVVLHWFTGSKTEAVRALDSGCYFSINNSMTKTSRGRDIIRLLPINRILTETDGPFIRDEVGNPLQPFGVRDCIESIASIKGVEVNRLIAQVLFNLNQIVS